MPELTHASPAYSKKYGVVGIGCNDGIFRLFEAKKGNLLWEYKTGGEIKASATFDEVHGNILFGSFDGKMYVCNVHTGNLVNTYQTDGPIYSTPLIVDQDIYVSSIDKCLYCVDSNTFTKKWFVETEGRVFTNPVLIKNKIFIGSNDGFLHEISREGQVTDFFLAGERIVNNVVYNSSNDTYLLPTGSNELYCLEKKQSERA